MEKSRDEIMADSLRIVELRGELFGLANSYAGDVTGGTVGVPLHGACNHLLEVHAGMLNRLQDVLEGKQC